MKYNHRFKKMNIQLNNLGPIKEFNFDLSKDLTIIFGKNNIGKSYAISAIYLILKSFSNDDFRDNPIEMALYFYRREKKNSHGQPKVIKEIIELEEVVNSTLKKEDQIEISKEFKKLFTNIISSLILPSLEKSFRNSFSSLDLLKNKLSNERFSILVQFKSFEFRITISKDKMVITNLKFEENIIIRKSTVSKKPEHKEGSYILYYNTSRKDKEQIIDALFLEYYVELTNEINQVFGNIYFLPASRSGLYQALSAFNAVIAELSKSRTFLSNKLELPNISEPVLDYFLSLANVNDKRVSKRFVEIVKLIEHKILQGKVSFNNETKKLSFSPANIGGEFDLAYTSSMISEIAPIVAFFKYVVSDTPNRRLRYRIFNPEDENKRKLTNLIFIEEPEAHLHPEIQVILMEIFCEIVKYDVKIVMTSHSNYMFNKLSNLVLENNISFEKVGSYLMRMDNKGSISDTISMAADSQGMRDENFVDVAEELYNERINIYDKLNSNAS